MCALVVGGAVLASASSATAQSADAAAMSPLDVTVACSSPASVARPPDSAPRVIGAQDTVYRRLFGPRDLLVVNAGTGSGVQLGQRFFVRRENQFGSAYGLSTLSSRTLGWVRIVAVDTTTAIATIERACDGIIANDYLEAFVAPDIPADAATNDPRGEPDFTVLSRVLAGNDDHQTAVMGDVVMIEALGGSLTTGTRLAVYRDLRVNAMPLSAVGEAVVVGVGPNVALARITRARDAVLTGDYMAVRK
jgi:hypothetical protein